MSNAWGTPQEHHRDAENQRLREQGLKPHESSNEDSPPDNTVETFDVPTVVMPDGTTVPASKYDPFTKERENIIADRGRVDGMMDLLRKRQDTGTGDGTEPTEDEPDSLFKPIEFNEEEVVVGETDRVLAQAVNNIGEVLNGMQQNSAVAELTETVNKLAKTVGNKFLEDELDRISATTGFTKEQLIQANEQTGIDSPEMVATYLKGVQAEETAAKEAEAAAAEERKKNAAGINGTSSGGAGGEGGPETRPNIDYSNPVEVAKHFNFMPKTA